MTDYWTPMLVIRPELGMARLEDSQLRIAEEVNPEVLARQIATGSTTIGSLSIDETQILSATRFQWVSQGWRPSLEYFDWSEGGRGATDQPSLARIITAESDYESADVASRIWRWAEVAGPTLESDRTVGDILIQRRTIRSYDAQPLDQEKFARILHDFVGILKSTCDSDCVRVGLRLAAVVYAVDGLAAGLWDLDLFRESATLAYCGELRDAMSDLMCGMQAPKTATATVVVIADFPERQRHFPYERALRELYIEVGRIAQWLILVCESHGLGCLITPATNDKALSEILNLPMSEAPVYTITFGRRDAGTQRTAS